MMKKNKKQLKKVSSKKSLLSLRGAQATTQSSFGLLHFVRNDKMNQVVLFLFILLLPTQLGKHFFLPFSFLSGVRIDYLAPTLYLTDILVALLIVTNSKIILPLLKNKNNIYFILVFLANILFAKNPYLAFYGSLKILELVLVFVIFKNIKINNKFLINSFLISSLFEFFLAVLQFINKHSIQGIFYFFGERYLSLSTPDVAKASLSGAEFLRPYGTFSHPNSMAGFFLLVYSFFLIHKDNSLTKTILVFSSAFLVLISFSKIAIFGLILVTLFYLASGWKESICKVCIISKLVIFTMLGVVFISAQTDPLSVSNRQILLKNSFEIIRHNPLFGVGLNNYLLAQAKSAHQLFIFRQPVHNIFLLFIAEMGIILGGIVVYFLQSFFSKYIKNRSFLILFIAFLITGMFDHYWLTLHQNILVMGVLFGLSINPAVLSSRRS